MIELRTYEDGLLGDVIAVFNRETAETPYTPILDSALFRSAILDHAYFDPEGLIAAYSDGQAVGLAHAGF